ncbi:MAG: transketolase [Nanoarchaeota archaeon]
MDKSVIQKIKENAILIRKDSIRITTLVNSGHPGGSLSAADIFATLYFHVLKHNPKKPDWEDRDRFILSAGHICPALYCTMAHAGYFPVEELNTLRKYSSRLQGHPSRTSLPGIETSTGSLGQGISVSIGMALGLKLKKSISRVYCLMGDGEQNEGQVWEAAQSAAQYKLDNLTGIVDWNDVQQDGRNSDVMGIEPLKEKYESFGWHAITIDGNNVEELLEAFDEANRTKGKPSVILAKTVMGKHVSFMEGKFEYHGKTLKPEQAEKAYKEIENAG